MILRIEHIRRDYAGRCVLQDCSHVFAQGGTTVLMGPNGSGKSTLLRICALLEPPDEGTLTYEHGGTVLPHDLALRRRMTLVLPRTGVFNASVFDNVAYGLKVRHASPPAIAARVSEVLAMVGLDHKARQNGRTLSSGETQRLGLARALAIRPEILFLDEPTASVDEENTVLIEETIRSLRCEGKTAIVMTTHDRDQAERLADHLLMLRHGVLSLSME
jgi:tungstate transport system ATP-binding protein